MADVKISALPTKTIASTDVVPVVDASFTTTSRVTAGAIAACGPPASHKASHQTGGTDALTASDIGAQPSDAELTAIAGLTSAADRLPYFTGSGTAALAVFTSTARSLLDDASTAAMLTTLGAAASTHTHAPSAITQASATTHQVLTWSGSAWAPATVNYANISGTPTIPTLGRIWALS